MTSSDPAAKTANSVIGAPRKKSTNPYMEQASASAIDVIDCVWKSPGSIKVAVDELPTTVGASPILPLVFHCIHPTADTRLITAKPYIIGRIVGNELPLDVRLCIMKRQGTA